MPETEDPRRTSRVNVPVSEDERRRLSDAAKRAHLPTAAWLRALGLAEAARTEPAKKSKRRGGA